MNKEMVDTLKTLFQGIKIPTVFGPDDYDSTSRVERALINALKEIGILPHTVEIHCGCTKAVIIFEEYDYVIKIPFKGTWIGVYDDEGCYDYDNFEFMNYESASYSEDEWNYCESELNIYKKIKESGFDNFIAPVDFLCFSKNNYPIYIQEKAIIFSQSSSNSATENSAKEAFTLIERHHTALSVDWIALAIDYYGKSIVDNFLSYLDETDMIEDLHSGNIGFTIDDMKPVIIDYAGFNS